MNPLEAYADPTCVPATEPRRLARLLDLDEREHIDEVTFARRVAAGLPLSAVAALGGLLGRARIDREESYRKPPCIATGRAARRCRGDHSERVYGLVRVLDAVAGAFHGDVARIDDFLKRQSPASPARRRSAARDGDFLFGGGGRRAQSRPAGPGRRRCLTGPPRLEAPRKAWRIGDPQGLWPEAIERLLAAQITLRNSRRLATAMRSSRLPAIKTLEDFDFSFQPSIKREQIDSLHELGFLERKENVVFLGPPGVGKTHLAISLAITTAESGAPGLLRNSDRPHRLPRRGRGSRPAQPPPQDPHPPRAPGRGRNRLPPGHPQRRHPLLPARQPRYEHASTVVTSNKGFEQWGEILHDEVMAAALLDRLLHRCHIVNIRGNSYRMRRHMELSKAIHPTASRAVSAEHAGTGEQRHDGCPDSIGSPRSGRYAPSAAAPEKCAFFNGHKCALFGGH